jgi:hypothetical protein
LFFSPADVRICERERGAPFVSRHNSAAPTGTKARLLLRICHAALTAMPIAHPVYQTTTVNYDEYSTDGAYRGGGGVFFLRSSSSTSRWPGRKRRMRIAVVISAVVAAIAAVVTLAVSHARYLKIVS